MPRQPREKSTTCIYHVMVRGVGRMTLFPNAADKIRYLSLGLKYKKQLNISVIAYCLMDNHVHLLLKENKDNLADLMHRMGISFSQYFNRKYQRVGHVFQNRYRSDAIEDEKYFMQCARYIHNNPVKVGMVNAPAQYRWSSYQAYMADKADELVDKDLLLSCYSANMKEAVDTLKQFTEGDLYRDYTFAEDEDKADQINTAQKTIAAILAENKIEAGRLRFIPAVERARILHTIKEKTNISNREIAAFLQVGKDMVNRA